MFSKSATKAFLVLLSLFLSGIAFQIFVSQVFAKNSDGFNFEICESDKEIDKECKDLSPKECKELLQKCQKYFEEKSAEIAKDISKTEQEKKTLQNQIYSLKKKIQSLNYQIYQSNLMVKDLSLQIDDTQFSINKISLKIEDSRNQLADIIRLIYAEEQKSILEIALTGDFSNFFDNLTNLESLNGRLQDILENTRNLKEYLESKKQEMAEEKNDLENVIRIQQLQKEDSARTKKEQEYYLKLSEQEYQKKLEEKKKTEERAAEIRARIFELIGVSKAPTFGEAYEIAKYVSQFTGIRPALLLAVLTQESRLGKNVGQCYLKNTTTGDGVYIKTGNRAPRTMSPKQVPYFLEIIERINKKKELARDPFETPVSCAMYYHGKPYGWGGAMGPSQFMPATWMKYGYGERVEKITGRVSDPWDIRDAFLATALYLQDLGGTKNEFNAVMHYFSGSSWKKWEEFYGRSVLGIANQYERDIAELEKGGN